jgi:bifunctional ADP-heptose synthase (sugar kinase/adenylyltransferase)
VTIYNHPTANNCIEAIEIIKPDIFTKGGDRDNNKNVPEADLINSYGGQIVYNVGDPKVWSSSDYLEKWVEFKSN